MKRLVFVALCLCFASMVAVGQKPSYEEIVFLTAEWEGERFEDGRPKVPDDIVARMKNASIEEAWGVLRGHDYHNQFEGGWMMIHDDVPIVGRAVTAHYVPTRPELNRRILDRGHDQGRIGPSNSWPIDELVPGDVYVADGFGKVIDGTLIGDNLGNSIYAKTGNGVVFDGGLRDLEGLAQIDGFNAFVRGWDPSYLMESMLIGLNSPVRIGRATVLPGDIVLAKREGVVFVPAHMAEEVVVSSEIVSLQDQFGHQRLREGRYTPGQIDTRWSEEIRADFLQWLEENPEKLAVPKEDFLENLRARGW